MSRIAHFAPGWFSAAVVMPALLLLGAINAWGGLVGVPAAKVAAYPALVGYIWLQTAWMLWVDAKASHNSGFPGRLLWNRRLGALIAVGALIGGGYLAATVPLGLTPAPWAKAIGALTTVAFFALMYRVGQDLCVSEGQPPFNAGVLVTFLMLMSAPVAAFAIDRRLRGLGAA